ncbi:1c2bf7bf-9164-4c93-beac-69aacbdd679f [Thermothielavioides terrestris]|uniref:1c2bf7bf-9164-4c93-beac-69aacbdd679f n=1 Tax=Thermothielavioides terrestris TaxID=2587410 RepID=A0A3S4BB25_9PEZI|nr:1c2bf7bf-9164-4c93-beac-69aacbdd679f [Thermothielavioides terrestris]
MHHARALPRLRLRLPLPLPLHPSSRLFAKRHVSVSAESEYQVREVRSPVDLDSFHRIVVSARRQAVVFRNQVQADDVSSLQLADRLDHVGTVDGDRSPGTPAVALPASSKWFAPAGKDGFPDMTSHLRGHLQSHFVPYELLAPGVGDEVFSAANSLGRFSRWLSVSSNPLYRALHQVLLQQIRPGHDESMPLQKKDGPVQFIRFSAPLALLDAAVEYNREHPTDCISTLYIAQVPISDLPEALRSDVPTPRCLASPPAGDEPLYAPDVYTSSLWLGLTPTYTPWHRDPNHNLFCQLCGTKVVRMMPPSAGEDLFRKVMAGLGKPVASVAIRGEEMMMEPERQAFLDAVWGAHPPEDMLEVTLNPRDVMFLRTGWWHSVRSVGDPGRLNASVNWWFRFRDLRRPERGGGAKTGT